MTDVSHTADNDTTRQTSGGSGGGTQSSSGPSGGQSGQDGTADRLKSGFASLKSQATDKAFEYANQGKNKATGALDEAAKFLEDSARTIDEKLGSQYGSYARNAADSVSGLAANLRGKNMDELVEDARDLVRKSPAVAIGAAVATGFLIARIAKAGVGYEPETGGTGGQSGSGSTGTSSQSGTGAQSGTGTQSSTTGQSGASIGSTTPTYPA